MRLECAHRPEEQRFGPGRVATAKVKLLGEHSRFQGSAGNGPGPAGRGFSLVLSQGSHGTAQQKIPDSFLKGWKVLVVHSPFSGPDSLIQSGNCIQLESKEGFPSQIQQDGALGGRISLHCCSLPSVSAQCPCSRWLEFHSTDPALVGFFPLCRMRSCSEWMSEHPSLIQGHQISLISKK